MAGSKGCWWTAFFFPGGGGVGRSRLEEAAEDLALAWSILVDHRGNLREGSAEKKWTVDTVDPNREADCLSDELRKI